MTRSLSSFAATFFSVDLASTGQEETFMTTHPECRNRLLNLGEAALRGEPREGTVSPGFGSDSVIPMI
jgi:hypothetical protein